MIKRIGTFAASTALVAALCVQPAFASTATANFSVHAVVNTIATLSFTLANSNTFQWTQTANTTDNTHQFEEADNTGTISATLRTGAAGNGGAGSIYVTSPNGSLTGSGTNTQPESLLGMDCTGSYTQNSSGGSTSGVTTGVQNSPASIVPNSSNNPCVTFTAPASITATSLTLHFYLDDRYLPADTYDLSGFVLTVSAT